ncbi:hypothetical protein KC354_g2121 [Hortaea werneckii]|nr:hypothetical protein KC354_g2121 [Hortaea werneckii]
MAESDTQNGRPPNCPPASFESNGAASEEHHSFLGPQSHGDIELDSIDACSHRSSSSRTSSEAPREHHGSTSYAPLHQGDVNASSKTGAQSETLVVKAIDDEESGLPPSTRLKRSIYTIVIALVYSSLALFAWILLCVQSFRPITTESYRVNVLNGSVYYDFTSHGGPYPQTSPYVRNEEYFQGARVVQALTSVLTIPLTSALCSKAAVAFFQRKASMGLSMRKLTTMADRGWTDPETILKVLFGGFKRWGSSFLLFAILLNVLGAVIAPLTQVFLSTKTIKVPAYPSQSEDVMDIMDYFADADKYSYEEDWENEDNNRVSLQTRSFLTSASTYDLQPRIWQESYNCSWDMQSQKDKQLPDACKTGGTTFGVLSLLKAPYLAQLPKDYNTGVVRQFIPRFNVSISRENITEQGMPSECNVDQPGIFYVNYANEAKMEPEIWPAGEWGLEACMPDHQGTSPWKATRSRQDFTETLYMKLKTIRQQSTTFPDVPQTSAGDHIFKITLNTTAGYFELPNYMNGQTAGPLLTDGPRFHCGVDCPGQENYRDGRDVNSQEISSRQATQIVPNSTVELENVANKGPLLTVAMALFGENSFIPTRLSGFAANLTNGDDSSGTSKKCVDQAPLMGLLHDTRGTSWGHVGSIGECITELFVSTRSTDEQIAAYVKAFIRNDGAVVPFNEDETMTNAFLSAAYLALEAWMDTPYNKRGSSIMFDLGADTDIPVISKAGMVLISGLLGLDLACLLGLAIYSSLTRTWTDQFDAFAMMRLGAAMHENVPLHVSYSHSRVKALDTTSGFPPSASSNSPSRSPSGNALSQSHSKASPVLKPSSLKTDSSIQSTPLHSPNPHHQRKDSNSLQPSPAVSHRSSFAENLRTYPPSPRSQRHQSFSGQALTELLMHPPVKGSGDDARFKGRDWRNIQISEIIEPAETRFVELSSSIEATTKLLIKSGAPNVVLIRESTKTKTAISTFDFSDLNAYLLLVLGLSQPDDLASKLAERAKAGEAIPLSDAMDHLRAREEPAFLPHTATLTRAMEVLGGGAHRVLINKEGSSETIGILTQLRLVRFFWENHKNFAATEALYARSLKDLQLGAKEVLAINGDKPLSDALRLMHDEGITSLPVLDSHRNVVGNISHVDVRLLTDTSSIPLLSLSCIHFISVILSERGLADGKDSFPVFHVAPFSTLAHTVAKLCATRSHRMWIVDAPSPSTTVPPSPAVHSNTQPINIEHTASHLPAPAAHMASPPKGTAGSDMTPGPPFTSVNPGVTISASQLPGAAMSGRLSGVVSLTDVLNLFARASGLHPGDPEEMRKLRRRSSSSSSRPNIDSVRASAEYMRSSVELGRSSSTSSRR